MNNSKSWTKEEKQSYRLFLAQQYLDGLSVENKNYSPMLFESVAVQLHHNCLHNRDTVGCQKCREYYGGECFSESKNIDVIASEIGRFYPEMFENY